MKSYSLSSYAGFDEIFYAISTSPGWKTFGTASTVWNTETDTGEGWVSVDYGNYFLDDQ